MGFVLGRAPWPAGLRNGFQSRKGGSQQPHSCLKTSAISPSVTQDLAASMTEGMTLSILPHASRILPRAAWTAVSSRRFLNPGELGLLPVERFRLSKDFYRLIFHGVAIDAHYQHLPAFNGFLIFDGGIGDLVVNPTFVDRFHKSSQTFYFGNVVGYPVLHVVGKIFHEIRPSQWVYRAGYVCLML